MENDSIVDFHEKDYQAMVGIDEMHAAGLAGALLGCRDMCLRAFLLQTSTNPFIALD